MLILKFIDNIYTIKSEISVDWLKAITQAKHEQVKKRVHSQGALQNKLGLIFEPNTNSSIQ
jgi:hypothetical protein